MFEGIRKFFKGLNKKEEKNSSSKDAAKERLHLVLMQDRANVSADFLELMKQEIIEVIKKYIDIDEKEIDVRLTNKENEDGTNGAPALYANIPILNIKNEARKITTNKGLDDKEKEKIENNKNEKDNDKKDNDKKDNDKQVKKINSSNNQPEKKNKTNNKVVDKDTVDVKKDKEKEIDETKEEKSKKDNSKEENKENKKDEDNKNE